MSAAQPERGGGGASGRGSVAVLEKRGRFFTATPFFARGRRINLDKPPREVRSGDLVLVTPTGSRGGLSRLMRRPRAKNGVAVKNRPRFSSTATTGWAALTRARASRS